MSSKTAKEQVADLIFSIVSRRAFVPLSKALFRIATAGLGLGMSGDNQPDERMLLRRLRSDLPCSPVVLDVGGNCGQYALMAQKELPKAQIISFEPHPSAFARLSKIPGIRAVNMAVGDRSGSLILFDYAHEPGSEHASAVPGVLEEIHRGVASAIPVECTTIDSFLEASGLGYIDLLKIDVEGFELPVLKGAQRSIVDGRIGFVQFEFNSMNTITRTFISDFAKALPGYRLHRVLRNGDLISISDEPPVRRELFGYQNVLAIKPRVV